MQTDRIGARKQFVLRDGFDARGVRRFGAQSAQPRAALCQSSMTATFDGSVMKQPPARDERVNVGERSMIIFGKLYR